MSQELNVKLLGFSRIDYNKSVIRKALPLEINQVRDVARTLVSGNGVSRPGEMPGLRTGTFKRAIKSKVTRSGLAAIVRPEKTTRMGKDYYPAFLVNGVKKRKNNALNPGLQKRADPMPEALSRRTTAATDAIRAALQNALIPRA